MDGVDFDIEGGGELFYDALARRLSEHSQGGKKVLLTAAPQCPYSDEHYLKRPLNTGLFDYVLVQVYNNQKCEYSPSPSGFKDAWNQWTSSVHATQFFVGLPASMTSARTGYLRSADLINQVLPFVKKSGDKYGGVMLFDRAGDIRSDYSSKIRNSV